MNYKKPEHEPNKVSSACRVFFHVHVVCFCAEMSPECLHSPWSPTDDISHSASIHSLSPQLFSVSLRMHAKHTPLPLPFTKPQSLHLLIFPIRRMNNHHGIIQQLNLNKQEMKKLCKDYVGIARDVHLTHCFHWCKGNTMQ